MNRITEEFVKSIIREKRPLDTDKRDYGNLLIFAGKEGMAGAAILASKASLRSGVGLVKVATPKGNFPVLQIAVPEAICITEEEAIEDLRGESSYYSAIAFGPGMGTGERTEKLLRAVTGYKGPVVIDADGLNVLAKNKELQQRVSSLDLVITPHKREAVRLLGKDNGEDRMRVCLELASIFNCVALLKGNETLVANGKYLREDGVGSSRNTDEKNVWMNTTGNPGMATAGSGDVLTGIIGSLMAQGINPMDAALVGSFVHGRAGDLAAELFGERSLMAGDIIDCLPNAFRI